MSAAEDEPEVSVEEAAPVAGQETPDGQDIPDVEFEEVAEEIATEEKTE